MTTEIGDFITALAAVSVTGVTRQFTYPPASLGTADLPASFPMPPSGQYEPISTCTDTDTQVTAMLVIAVEPVGQNQQSPNYAAILTMADALNTALRTNQQTLGALANWSINTQADAPIVLAGQAYWGVSATVTVRG